MLLLLHVHVFACCLRFGACWPVACRNVHVVVACARVCMQCAAWGLNVHIVHVSAFVACWRVFFVRAHVGMVVACLRAKGPIEANEAQ